MQQTEGEKTTSDPLPAPRKPSKEWLELIQSPSFNFKHFRNRKNAEKLWRIAKMQKLREIAGNLWVSTPPNRPL